MVVIGLIELRIAFLGLVCLGSGVALCVYTFRVWKEARPESPALAPLEVMSDDAYISGDDAARRELLHMAREIVSAATGRAQREKVSDSQRRRPPAPPRQRTRERVVEEREVPVRQAPIDPLLK